MKLVPAHFHWLPADDNCIVGWSLYNTFSEFEEKLIYQFHFSHLKIHTVLFVFFKRSIAWTTSSRYIVLWCFGVHSSSNFIMTLLHSTESDSRRDSQKPERAYFPTRSFVCILPSLLGLSTTKKFENVIVAKKKVILKPRLPAFMNLLVVTIYD